MESNQEEFYRMTNGNSRKMPFYMTYPMQNLFLEEAEYERDMNRLKNMYPEEVRRIQDLVDEECDKMEYEGSLMFDEYPDRLMLRQITGRIGQKLMEEDNANAMQSVDFEAEQYEPVEAEELRIVGQRGPGGPGGPGGPPPFRPPVGPPHRPPQRRPDGGRENLIEVLLFNEMFNRRCRHRRCRRWW